jgi:hypothetical protein
MKCPLWLAILVACRTLAAAPSADALLKAAEHIRSPEEEHQVDIQLVDEHKGSRDVRTYEADISGHGKARVKFLTPPVDKGTKLLMVDNDMWVYMPSAAKPIRVSARQRLTGNAVYGDIVRLQFVGNYKAELSRQEKFQGRNAYVLLLTAIDGRPVTYDRIEYWVDATTHSPLKALYESPDGKILREGYFDKFRPVFGVKRPSHFRLIDHLEPSHITTLVFSGEKRKKLPDLLFERENFARD